MRFFCFILFIFSLFGAEFDYAVVGTSPISLFEALYKHHSGQRVVIFEAGAECGGAWQSIDICGVMHADMGCHEICSNPELNLFLEHYAGCSMISSNTNYYFSRGCFELIGNLLKRIASAKIPIFTECRIESVRLDMVKGEVELKTGQGMFTAKKMVVTPGSSFDVEGILVSGRGPHKFYHLYLLLQDPTPPRFSYHGGMMPGVSRMMNLTAYAGLQSTGRQLIVLQTYSDAYFSQAQSMIDHLKKKQMISEEAYLLEVDSYIYEQGPYFQMHSLKPSQQAFFEMLNTSHFNVIGTYAPKWKQVIPIYREGSP